VDDYLRLRRAASGAPPTVVLVEFGLEIPEEVMQHEVVKEMRELAIDLIIFVNVRTFYRPCSQPEQVLTFDAGYAFLQQRAIIQFSSTQRPYVYHGGTQNLFAICS